MLLWARFAGSLMWTRLNIFTFALCMLLYFFIQTNSCTLFKTNSHSNLKHQIVKNVCKNIIKTLHVSVTTVWPSSVFHAWCRYYFSACLHGQAVYLVCGCMLFMCVCAWCTCLSTDVCACLMYLSVYRRVCVPDVLVCWQTCVRAWCTCLSTDKYIRHAHT
jgi:hypothetical protein